MAKRIVVGLGALTLVALAALMVLGSGVLGRRWGAGEVQGKALPNTGGSD